MKKNLVIPFLLLFLLLNLSCRNQVKNSLPSKRQQLIKIIKKAGFLKLPLNFEVLGNGLKDKYLLDHRGYDSLVFGKSLGGICGFFPDTTFYYSVVLNSHGSAFPWPYIMTFDKNGNEISSEGISAFPGCVDTPIESTSCYDSVWIDVDFRIRSIAKVIGKIYNPSTNKDEDICNMNKLDGYIDKNGKIYINKSDVILCDK
ncbi:MAG: hypothetical protein HOO91_12725 [Bacteroidales bacterium]|nr:hypothetical protein [Bacteroidales bacterium]